MKRGSGKIRSKLLRAILESFQQAKLSKSQLGAVEGGQVMSRREFLVNSGAAVVSLGTLYLFTGFASGNLLKREKNIAIVGAGLAGLNAAYTLQKAGIYSTVYEASNRAGGRVFTGSNLISENLTTEVGGEFIDSTHTDMFALASEFGLELIDTQAESLVEDNAIDTCRYCINGVNYTNDDIVKALSPFTETIQADIDSLPEEINYRSYGNADVFDKMSVSEYLTKIGIQGWLFDLLNVGYLSEYGMEPTELSALNFLFLFSTDYSQSGKFEASGISDQRYLIKGGNKRIIEELTSNLNSQIKFGHRLLKVKAIDEKYELTFANKNDLEMVIADYVVMALPFTVLRDIDLSEANFPEVKLRSINEIGYGDNSKFIIGFNKRRWREQGSNGYFISNGNAQNGWDSTFQQEGDTAALTVFVGGNRSKQNLNLTSKEELDDYLPTLETIYPGIKSDLNDKTFRFNWGNYLFAKGSYSSYKVGQWTTIGGAESEPVGNMFFAGEHCSIEFQGFMNGATETGRIAAEQIVQKLTS